MFAAKLTSRQIWLSIALFGLTVEIAIIALLIYNPPLTRLCKPVVPQIIVDLKDEGKTKDGKSLFLQYREAISDPLATITTTNLARFSGCGIRDGRCVSARARYEVRTESSRYQSISVFLVDGKRHASPSTITWEGPAYPDRVTMRCSLNDAGQPTGCKLIKLDYLAEQSNAHADKAEAANRRHDKCQPFISRLLHGTAEH